MSGSFFFGSGFFLVTSDFVNKGKNQSIALHNCVPDGHFFSTRNKVLRHQKSIKILVLIPWTVAIKRIIWSRTLCTVGGSKYWPHNWPWECCQNFYKNWIFTKTGFLSKWSKDSLKFIEYALNIKEIFYHRINSVPPISWSYKFKSYKRSSWNFNLKLFLFF